MTLDEKLQGLTGEIANQIKSGEPVQYGSESYEAFTIRDVHQLICNDDLLCTHLGNIELMFMEAVEDADAAVEAQILMDELTLDAIGQFAESIASRVYNYRVDNG